MGATEETFLTPVVPLDFTYNYYIGQYLTRYFEGFKERKILGSRCPGCNKIALPPRKYCGVCNRVMEEMVELPQEGTLENYTVGHVVMEKGGKLNPADKPYVLGLIRLDENASLLLHKVEGVDPDKVSAGMKVRAVWRDQVEGDYWDLDHFEPV